ncbi:SRPBCC family protein [Asanoa iriomotensis]|uniref:Transcriptional regulator n=1 Tax=Asanoa iriomotensis TaxID=234613 RepID=A0ABQ4CDG9_9ACTN|nr:SRPBCC family protein [Asanoa iriomotensis]GIF60813.1 transcriptional regulator [Asanoa iriomotensis]
MTDSETTVQVHRVYIKASAQAIWDAITKPEWTARYGHRGLSDYDLRPGGAFVGRANEGMLARGVPEVAVDGEVIEADPPHRLVQTFRMLMDPGLAAEGFTRLTYEIAEGTDGVCTLTVTHDLTGAPGLAALMRGDFEAMGAGGGWPWTLSGLKTLLETGKEMES